MQCLILLKNADLSNKPVKTRTLPQNISQDQRVRTLKGGGGGQGEGDNSLGQALHLGAIHQCYFS